MFLAAIVPELAVISGVIVEVAVLDGAVVLFDGPDELLYCTRGESALRIESVLLSEQTLLGAS